MIGSLPLKLNVNGVDRAIRSDFRIALLIFQAFNDSELLGYEKNIIMIKCLYKDFVDIPQRDHGEAIKQAIWFLDGGVIEESKGYGKAKKLMDWEQDEQMIFSAVNKVAGYETRASEHIHWWTFIGYFNEIGEGLFSLVMHIRHKLNKGEKLDKTEKEFYKENKSLVDLRKKYSPGQQAEIERINKLLNS